MNDANRTSPPAGQYDDGSREEAAEAAYGNAFGYASLDSRLDLAEMMFNALCEGTPADNYIGMRASVVGLLASVLAHMPPIVLASIRGKLGDCIDWETYLDEYDGA